MYPSHRYALTTVRDHAALLRKWTQPWIKRVASQLNRGDGRALLSQVDQLGTSSGFQKKLKNTINNHYNGSFLEPWGERTQRGYGIEVIDRFAREAAWVEFGGPAGEREQRLQQIRQLSYADLAADRQVVAAVEAMERILEEQAAGRPDRVARYDGRTIRLC